MIHKVIAILENKLKEQEEKPHLTVLEETVINPIKKEKRSAKLSKGWQNEFTENVWRPQRERKLPAKSQDSGDSPNFLTHVGMLVGVLWTENDLEGTNWDPGLYRGEAQWYDENDDQVFVFYLKDCAAYSLNVTGAFANGITLPSENLWTAATRAYCKAEQNNSLWWDEKNPSIYITVRLLLTKIGSYLSYGSVYNKPLQKNEFGSVLDKLLQTVYSSTRQQLFTALL